MDFVHLHCHSHFSLFDGVATIEELVDAARKNQMSSIALTEHGNLMSAVSFYRYAISQGIKPIIGMEAYVALQDRFRKDKDIDRNYYHLTLLAKNQEGYKNLIKISTDAYLNGFYYKPRTDLTFLSQHSADLIVLSGCPKGPLAQAYVTSGEDAAKQMLYNYLDIFGSNFYIELQVIDKEFETIFKFLYSLARKNNIKIVATNDVHFILPEDYKLQEIFSKLDSDYHKEYKIFREIYFKSKDEMIRLFREIPEAIHNTIAIAEQCNVKLDINSEQLHLPVVKIPEQFQTPDEYLHHLAFNGLQKKLKDIPEQYIERLEYELDVIKKTGFASYFLIIRDIVELARQLNVSIGPGRGSAAGSLVMYALDITKLDPIKNNLIFERFLNPERVSPPDVDIDFSDIDRDRLIEAVKNKYGSNSVAQIITYSTMKAKKAIKDVARILGVPFGEINEITKLIPNEFSLEDALKIPEVKQFFQDPKYSELFRLAQKLEGRIRNMSVHAAGIAITPGNLTEYVPLAICGDTVVTQFDMDGLKDLGILKIDALGLTTLSIIDRCIGLIRENRGQTIDLSQVPLNDQNIFDMLSKGHSNLVFQLDSDGMQAILKSLKPTSIEDIFAVVALFRSGPLAAGTTTRYINRKNGQEPIEYIFPELEEILKDTYGVIVYQEQIMQISMKIAGFSASEADILRAAIGKKMPHLMKSMKHKFITQAVSKGYQKDKVEDLWNIIMEFTAYSFNRAHAASYGLLAYWTAYLKYYFPIEYIVATLNAVIDSKKLDKIPAIISEAKKMNIRIIPPNINASQTYFTIKNGAIIFGLAAIKNVGVDNANQIKQYGNISKLEDLYMVSGINKKVIESLVKAGALDIINPNRSQLLDIIDKIGLQKNKLTGGLFPISSSIESTVYVEQNAKFEQEVLGLYLTASPLDSNPLLSCINAVPINQLNNFRKARLIGVVLNLERRKSRKGNYYARIKIEDRTGSISGLIFSNVLEKRGSILREGEVYVFNVSIEKDTDETRVIIDDVVPAQSILENPKYIIFTTDDVNNVNIDNLKKWVELYPGNTIVMFKINDKLWFSNKYRVKCNIESLSELSKYIDLQYVKII